MLTTEPDPLLGIDGARGMFSSPRIDRELVTDFFMTFARAEFALKCAGFVKAGPHLEPQVRWGDFASSLGDTVLSSRDPAVQRAIDYLTTRPPQKQCVKNGALTWVAREPKRPRDPVFLVTSITTVRNNLFHGGKEIQGPLTERDRRLIRSALDLLVYAVSQHECVLRAFQELQPEHDAA
jgi:hypothetical protein